MSQSVFRNVWFGAGAKFGGQLIAGGIESITGSIFNLSQPNWNYTFAIENARIGPGLGGTIGGLSMVFILNCPNAYTLSGMELSDWGVNFSIGSSWAGLFKAWRTAGLFSTAEKIRQAERVGHNLTKVINPSDIEKVKTSINYLWNASDMAKSRQPTIFSIDVPGVGFGAEISIVMMRGKFSII